MIMQVFRNDQSEVKFFYGFLVLPFFPKKAQSKKQSRDRNDFLLVMQTHEAKCPK